MARNKVKFNICNVHYPKQIAAEDGTVSYDTPIPMPGAVSLGMVNEMFIESRNDEYKGYKEVATQKDFDRF